jgi:hypothetical protein
MEIKFKYRPEIKSIEDLHPGDEFLVGDERWKVRKSDLSGVCFALTSTNTTAALIRASVPIERDIPYPEGGAEKWRIATEDDRKGPKPVDALMFDEYNGVWHPIWVRNDWFKNTIYAIPKAKPQDEPAPKEYTVVRVSSATGGSLAELHYDGHGNPLKPGDRVTVQRVSEQGEGT